MVDAALAALKQAQDAVIDALQMEFFCDDLVPPPDALGWSADAFKAFYESGGSVKPASATATPADSTIAATGAAEDGAADLPCPALMQFLEDSDAFKHLSTALATITWDEIDALYKEGRPKLLSRLGKLGVSLSDRQKFVTVFGKANKPAGGVKKGQPGGGRQQPEQFVVAPIDVPGKPGKDMYTDLKGYQEQIIKDGIPDRTAGLFPAYDEFLSLLGQQNSPCTKGLPQPTVDGGQAWCITENGWACGESAIEHGMDLRWFIKPGFEDQTLVGAVRYGDMAMVGRGCGTSVHGGAVETALDEATAECAKSKVRAVAPTSLPPHVRLRVRHCALLTPRSFARLRPSCHGSSSHWRLRPRSSSRSKSRCSPTQRIVSTAGFLTSASRA